MGITHSKVSAKSDGGDATLVRPSDWNGNHIIVAYDYKAMILAESSLIHYWPMDDATGTNIADAKASGGAWTGTQSVSTTPGRPLVVDGLSSRMLMDNRITYGTSRNLTPPWTLECWLVGGWLNSSPIGMWLGNNTGYMLYCVSRGQYRLYSNNTFTPTGYAHTPGDVVHLVGTHDGTTGNIYADGVLISSGALPTTSASSGTLESGAYANGGGSFSDGLLQHVAIYNTALSAGTALAHFNAGKLPFQNGRLL